MASIFSQLKLTRDEGMKLEKPFWEMIIVTEDCIEVYDFLKLCFRLCIIINNYVPIRPCFDDENEGEQWGCGFTDEMIGQFKQYLYNKNFTLQNQGKDYPVDTPENRIKI